MTLSMYCVSSDGELVEVACSQDNLDSVAIIIDDDRRRIYLWIGETADVRKKFIAARKATELKREKGLIYRIRNIDQGYESEEFMQLFM
ncbi:MAG: hypothetical protein ACFFBS_03590 [Promethearchaeota archaeon]